MADLKLEPKQIEATIERLQARIDERFPGSSLGNISRDLKSRARQAQARSEWLGRPLLRFRVIAWLLIALLLAGAVAQFYFLKWDAQGIAWPEFFQGIESLVNEVLLVGAAIFFLLTMETRYKRRQGLKYLHELRSIAHIIDMHQLTKDPERAQSSVFVATKSSPQVRLDSFQLRRYLDYCSELLSLTGKIAAEYVGYFDDAVLVSAVNEVETLTADLSRKIWQKIMIVHSFDEPPRSK
jgi:hypothetical protein